MDTISDGTRIWQWSRVSFETFGLALQYYQQAMAGIMSGYKFHDFSYAQTADLVCRCYKPLRHETPLTPEILKEMDAANYIQCKKKLFTELNWQAIYEQSIFASETFGKSIPGDTNQPE